MSWNAQRGVAILTFVTIILLGVTTLLVTQLSVNKQSNIRQASGLDNLADAKNALLGYALSQPVPGTLPCPDNTGDGLANPQGAACSSQLGLLPYRTLNVADLTDGFGARLWYAVDLNYVSSAAALKNSSITTTLSLSGNPMAAVIIAPGPSLDNQSRRPLVIADFLEGINADGDLSTYDATQTATQNDQIAGLPHGQYWSLMERLVLTEAATLLNTYRLQCGEYPWAANFLGPFDSVNNQQIGALPLNSALPDDWGAVCGPGVAPVPAAWLVNHWPGELLYRMCQTGEGNCVTIIGDSASPAAGALVAPGISLAGQVRPDNDFGDYFEEENSSLPDSQFRRRAPINHSDTYNDVTRALSP